MLLLDFPDLRQGFGQVNPNLFFLIFIHLTNSMRFTLFLCLLAFLQASGSAHPSLTTSGVSADSREGNFTHPFLSTTTAPIKIAALTLSVDSIHAIDCLRPLGYLSVKAEGGTPAYSYLWSNGHTGPVAANLAAGTYDITVTDDLGATATVSATIAQNLTPPTVNAGADFIAQCANSIVSLNGSGSSGPEFAYLWTASGGGVIQSGSTTLSPVISHTGNFTLKITDTGSGCTATDGIVVGAAFQPPAAVVTGGTIKCSTPLVTLGATFNPNNAIFVWQGPSGFTANVPDPQVGIPGTYTFVLTDTITTCVGTKSTTVGIDTISPTAATSGGGVITCNQPTVNLFGSGTPAGVSYAWSGPNGFTSIFQNVVADAAGNYILTVTHPTNGCTATSVIKVTDNLTPPTVSASVNGVITCVVNSVQLFGSGSPSGITFAWTGPLAFMSSAQNPLAFAPGDYTLTVKSPSNGCTASTTVTVTSNTTSPGATATGGVKTCANPMVTLNASSNTPNVSYHWSSPGGFNSNEQNPQTGQIGTYTVAVTNPVNGCVSTATATVTQNLTPPTVQSTTTTVTCTNPSPQITASSQTPGATFSWTGPSGFTSNVNNPHVSEGGTYVVTATSPVNGCTSYINVYVNENTTPPYVYAGDDRALNCIFTSILANPLGTSTGGNFTYQWTTWDGHIVAGANTLYARFDTVGHYTLTVKNTQNGCTAVDSMEVTQSDPVTISANTLNAVSCNGGSNGSAKATGGGGSGVFNYSWSNGAHTATATGLAAGTYTVTATDGDGCSAVASVTVTQPTVLQATVSTTPQTTVGINNGTATVTPSGGTPSYSVHWSTGANTFTISGLAPGTYTVTVTDSKGCSQINTATVNAQTCALTGTVDASPLTCFGVSTGSALANIQGANGSISYQWSNGANTQTATGLAAGNYTVTATDANGCSITLSAQITGPQQLVLSVANQTNVLCSDAQTGVITVGVSGGTAPVSYVWSNGGTGAEISGLGVGSYTVTVTDANGCSKIQSAQITTTDVNPPQLVLKTATTELDDNGHAPVNAAMFDNGSTDECGIASWTVSPTSFDCGQLGLRTVTLTATDKNGNTATATASVNVTDKIVPVLTCPQNVTVSFCSSAVTYDAAQVSDNCPVTATSTLQSGLPSGSVFPIGTTEQVYTYTDAGGNKGACNFTITVADSLRAVVSAIPAACTAACDGSVSIVPSGGIVPVTVAWTDGQTGAIRSDLCPGTYEAILTDASGCTIAQSVLIDIKDVDAPVLVCPANISVGFCNPVSTFAAPQVTDNCPVDPLQVQLTAGLPSGSTFPLGATTQTYSYTDAGGNAGTCTFTVTVQPPLSLAINQIKHDIGGTGNGSISISVTGGGGPYTFAWTLNGVAFATTEDLSNLFAGDYTVTVTDANGCTLASAALNVSTLVSANEPGNDLSWSLYPNPASSEVFLTINDVHQSDLQLSVFDATGRLLQQKQIQVPGSEPIRLDLSDLPDGWLLFRLSGDEAYRVKTLVKSH